MKLVPIALVALPLLVGCGALSPFSLSGHELWVITVVLCGASALCAIYIAKKKVKKD